MQSHQRYMSDAQQLQLYVQSSRPSMSPHDSGISFMPSWREKTPDYALFGSASYRRHSLPSDLPHSEPFQASFPSTNYGHYNPNPNGQRAPPSNVDHYYRNHSYIQNVQNGIGAGSPTSASGGEYYAGRNAGGGSAIRNGHHSTNTTHSHRFHPSNTVGSYPPSSSSSSGMLNYQRQHRQSQMYPPPILDSSSISPRKKRVYLPKESTNILKNWLLVRICLSISWYPKW
ncbi:hypothetical protein BKA69DRAFT_643792 [Paraphysoderma sedebokerense]|nr:hypothetical protein BKA69DRAFT_643792 [Paraphysoderma sedebokerense]